MKKYFLVVGLLMNLTGFTQDIDGDGFLNNVDNCPTIHNITQMDQDADNRGDVCDNCPFMSNYTQIDSDMDGVGDVCDNCPYVSNLNQQDINGNGIGDACDPALNMGDFDYDSVKVYIMKNNSGIELVLVSKDVPDFVLIYDLKGRLIRSFNNPSQKRMNMEELAEGIYIVRVNVKDKLHTRKIKL